VRLLPEFKIASATIQGQDCTAMFARERDLETAGDALGG
jgi:hypothetical protein